MALLRTQTLPLTGLTADQIALYRFCNPPHPTTPTDDVGPVTPPDAYVELTVNGPVSQQPQHAWHMMGLWDLITSLHDALINFPRLTQKALGGDKEALKILIQKAYHNDNALECFCRFI